MNLLESSERVLADLCDQDTGWYYQFKQAVEEAKKAKTPPVKCPKCGESAQGARYGKFKGEDGGYISWDVIGARCDHSWVERYHFYNIVEEG